MKEIANNLKLFLNIKRFKYYLTLNTYFNLNNFEPHRSYEYKWVQISLELINNILIQ